MLSCKKATELIDKKIHYKISVKENLQLKLHKSMCNACSAYEKQIQLIDKVLSQDENKIENIFQHRPAEQFKEYLIDKFKE